MSSLAEVRLWGRRIGAVSLSEGEDIAAFQYTPEFAASGIQPAPLTMPLDPRIYQFPALPRATFHGLPGLLADSLPDRYGHALIDAWLASQGRPPDSFDAVERLCYTGNRGMGALEYRPATGPLRGESHPLEIEAMVELASSILSQRQELRADFSSDSRQHAMRDILQVGTSAGGARAKAVIAWNPQTGQVRSGQVEAGSGFEYWLLKFDGVAGNRDRELEDPQGYGVIEYAYSLMAVAAGLDMMPCRLMREGPRQHFMTRRFDRTPDGGKLHMQSLGALAHYDYNAAGAHSWEQALAVARELQLGMDATEQLYRRAVFNIMARNQDDHVKNIAFLMDRQGRWSLAPAYDLTYSYNPAGLWTARHQMSLNGKREHFEITDLLACAATAAMQRSRAEDIIASVLDALLDWPQYAAEAGLDGELTEAIAANQRVDW